MYAADTWKARRNLTLDFGVRYSILTPTFQPNNQSTSFRENLYNPALGTDACNGLVTVPGYTPCANANKVFGTNFTEAAAGQNRYLRDVNYHLFAPRLGISWDPTAATTRFALDSASSINAIKPRHRTSTRPTRRLR